MTDKTPTKYAERNRYLLMSLGCGVVAAICVVQFVVNAHSTTIDTALFLTVMTVCFVLAAVFMCWCLARAIREQFAASKQPK